MAKKFLICTQPGGEKSKVFGDSESKATCLRLGDMINFPQSKSSDCYQLKLYEVDYDKSLYTQTVLKLHFTVTKLGTPDKTLLKILKNELIDNGDSMVDVFGYNSLTQAKTPTERLPICNNCYVYSFNLRQTDASNYSCIWKCFSYDRKLTLKKGCAAYSGVKFGSDIFNSCLSTNLKGMYEFKPERLLMMGCNSDAEPVRSGHSKVELKHPYLVRYNESIYDFFVRVAHRCGEFLYFEEGKLCLGLPAKTIKAIADNRFSPLAAGSVPICTYNQIGGEEDDADAFSTNYVEGVLESKDDKNYYDIQSFSDEYLHLISFDDDMKNTIGTGWWCANKALSTCLTSTDFITGLTTSLCNLGKDLFSGFVTMPGKLNEKFKSDYIQKDNSYASDFKKSNKDALNDNLNNAFYQFIENLECKAENSKVLMNFSSTVPKLLLGDSFTLNDGIYDGYVVTRIHGSFKSGDVKNEAEAVPVLSKPLGRLSRVVVPPAGGISHKREVRPMEAVVSRNDDPLRLGRVKVKYPWQSSDDKAETPWIRVAVPFAGSDKSKGGFMMVPDVGEHVMLKYLSGNIERPYVDGSLYTRYKSGNKLETRRPFCGNYLQILSTLTGETGVWPIMSSNGHMLAITDQPDTSIVSSLIPLAGTVWQLFHISDFKESQGAQNIPGIIAGGDITLIDGSMMCMLNLSPDKRSITVASDFGTVNISAFTGMNITAPNGDIKIKGKNVTIEAGNNISLHSGTNIKKKPGNIAELAGTAIGGFVGQFGAKMASQFLGVNLEGCLDLTFLRCLWEILMRPVEGTLSFTSNRNMTVTAGTGKVSVPRNLLSQESKYTTKGKMPFSSFGKSESLMDLVYFLEVFASQVDAFVNSARDEYRALIEKETGLWNLKNNKVILYRNHFNQQFADKEQLSFISDCRNGNAFSKNDVVNANDKTLDDFYSAFSKLYNDLKEAYDSYSDSYLQLKKLQKLFDKYADTSGLKINVSDYPAGLKNFCNKTAKADLLNFNPETEQDTVNDFASKWKKYTVVNVLLSSGLVAFKTKDGKFVAPNTQNSVSSDTFQQFTMVQYAEMWEDFPNSLVAKGNIVDEAKSGAAKEGFGAFGKSLAGSILSPMGLMSYNASKDEVTWGDSFQKLFNINGTSGPRAYSEVSSKGNILMSSSKDKTLLINDAGNAWESILNAGDIDSVRVVMSRLLT